MGFVVVGTAMDISLKHTQVPRKPCPSSQLDLLLSLLGVAAGKFNEASGTTCTNHPTCNSHPSRRTGSCYRDEDCQFYNKDSSGQLTGEIVGTCERVSSTLSTCKCFDAYFGVNCEYSELSGFMGISHSNMTLPQRNAQKLRTLHSCAMVFKAKEWTTMVQ